MIGSILTILLITKRYQRFEGQLFLFYIVLYSIGRSVIEIFRGDAKRGFIIDGYVSHSQFISLILISVIGLVYWYLYKKGMLKKIK